MSVKTTKLKISYTELTASEKEELKIFIRDYDKKYTFEKHSATESLKKSLGPIDRVKCSCCGK
jgi:DNA integrity scanning protein DisA with diadenylate cyclase activity